MLAAVWVACAVASFGCGYGYGYGGRGHPPLLLGLNVTSHFSIVPSLGLSYSLAEQPPSAAGDIELSQVLYGLFARAGLGLDLRVTPSFALHPELTVLRGFGDSKGYLVFTGGLGLVFGGLADY